MWDALSDNVNKEKMLIVNQHNYSRYPGLCVDVIILPILYPALFRANITEFEYNDVTYKLRNPNWFDDVYSDE